MYSPTMRPWPEIVQELLNQTDGQRITDLAQELKRAIKEQIPHGEPIIPKTRSAKSNSSRK